MVRRLARDIRTPHVLVVAFAVQLMFAVVVGERIGFDVGDFQTFYGPVAENLLSGTGYELNGEFPTRYPPGFPLILVVPLAVARWLPVSPELAIKLMQSVLMAATAAGLFVFVRRHFDQRAAVAAAGLWIVYPMALFAGSFPLTEVPFMALVVAGLVVLPGPDSSRKWLRALGAGAILGVSALVRPAGIAIWAPVVVWLLLAGARRWNGWSLRRAAAAASFVLLGFVVSILPWEIAVWSATSDVVPLSTGGRPSVIAGFEAGIGLRPIEGGRRIRWPSDVEAMMRRVLAQSATAESTRDLAAVVLDEAGSHPVTFLKLVAIRAARAWYGTDTINRERIIGLMQIVFAIPVGVGVALALASSRVRPAAVLCLLLVAYLWLVTITTLPLARYTLPAGLLLFPFGGLAIGRYLLSPAEPDLTPGR